MGNKSDGVLLRGNESPNTSKIPRANDPHAERITIHAIRRVSITIAGKHA